jgi:hypothetical protein
MWALQTDLQASKPNTTSPHTKESTSTGNEVIAAVILRRKSERDSQLSLCTMSFICPQKRSLLVLSEDSVGPINRPSPADPMTRKLLGQTSAYKGNKMGWCPLSLFWRNKSRLMASPSCLCVWVSPYQLRIVQTNLYEIWYIYHGTWAHLNGILHKSLPSVSIYMYMRLSLRGNGSVYMFPRQRIRETKKNCWTHCFLCNPCHTKAESVGLSVYPSPYPCKALAR